MLNFVFHLAAADFSQNVKEATESARFDGQDILVAISIGVGLGVLLFVWAYLRFRKKPEVVTRNDSPRETPTAPAAESSGDSERRRKRKKRRRRRDHRPRNPSLQQTGGLPPPRPDDQLPKY